MMLHSSWTALQRAAARDFTLFGLKAAIILLALVFIFLALTINNKWVLGGILAYEVLP